MKSALFFVLGALLASSWWAAFVFDVDPLKGLSIVATVITIILFVVYLSFHWEEIK